MERFTSFDGTGLAYRLAGAGPDVLLLHGHGGSSVLNWILPGVHDALVAAGRRVIALDFRGHGSSAKPHDPAAYGGEALRRDAQALLDHLGVAAVDVVAYSMGSLVALQLALADARVRSLLLGGAGLPGDDGRDTRMTSEDDELVFTAADPAQITQPDAAALRQFLDMTGADRAALLALRRAAPDPVPAIERIAVPCLVLTGDIDDVVGSPAALAQLIPGADVQLLPGDHLTVMADPGFVAAIVAFLDRVSPVGG